MLEELNLQESVEQTVPTEPSQPQQQTKDIETNMARMRENMKRMERERDEAARRAQELEQKYAKKEESYAIAPDDLVEGKHLSQYERKMKDLEERVARYEQQSSLSTAESRLRSQYNDFDSVVNGQNIEALREAYPEIAATINSNSDLYTKAASAYTLIKKLGIYKEDAYRSEREHASSNANKPRPLTSVSPQQGDSPLARANAFANGLTPELREQLHKEMLESIRRG
jgi:chromosome segregation ATPase